MFPKSVLVTGANGFLGRTIVTQLLQEDVTVVGTDRGLSPLVKEIEYRRADITRSKELADTFMGVNTVVHAAGLAHVFDRHSETEGCFRQVNEIGTKSVAEAAAQAGLDHFILISSVSVYGPSSRAQWDEQMVCRPSGSYALSKYNAELKAIEISERTGMALTILRLATLYGEEDPGNVARLIRSLDRGRFFWIGDGGNRKSLLYKEDAARACLSVMSRPGRGWRIYNVSAPPCTMREIVDVIAQELGKKPLPIRIPAFLSKSAGKILSCLPYRPLSDLQTTILKWLSEDVYDTSRFDIDFGFHPLVNLDEGLKRQVHWYRYTRGARG